VGEVTPKQLLEKFDQDFSSNPFMTVIQNRKGKLVEIIFKLSITLVKWHM